MKWSLPKRLVSILTSGFIRHDNEWEQSTALSRRGIEVGEERKKEATLGQTGGVVDGQRRESSHLGYTPTPYIPETGRTGTSIRPIVTVDGRVCNEFVATVSASNGVSPAQKLKSSRGKTRLNPT